MSFFFKTLSLAIRAVPHLFVSKFLYEMKWGAVCGIIALFSLMAMFTVLSLVIFFPISLAVAQSATSLGTLHSMLGFIGHAKGHQTDYLMPEILKTSIVRGIGNGISFGITVGVLLIAYGSGYLSLLFQSPVEFGDLELERMRAGYIPATGVAVGVFAVLSLAMEAVLAVPMAAAAYAIGPSDRSFNGFWGIGFRFCTILLGWISFGLTLLFFGLISLDLLTEEFHLASVLHLLGCYVVGTAPDLVQYPINLPVFDSTGAKMAGVILFFFGAYLPSPLWAATCARSCAPWTRASPWSPWTTASRRRLGTST